MRDLTEGADLAGTDAVDHPLLARRPVGVILADGIDIFNGSTSGGQ